MGKRLEIEEVFVGAKTGKAEESWLRLYDRVIWRQWIELLIPKPIGVSAH